jgi:hypothetical protein
MLSELRLVYHVALQPLFRTLFSTRRQAIIAPRVCAMPPSRGLLETNSFWAIDCRGCPGTLIDL